MLAFCDCVALRKAKRGLADRGGWHEVILPMPEIQTSFLSLPLDEQDAILGDHVRSMLANPLPPASLANL